MDINEHILMKFKPKYKHFFHEIAYDCLHNSAPSIMTNNFPVLKRNMSLNNHTFLFDIKFWTLSMSA